MEACRGAPGWIGIDVRSRCTRLKAHERLLLTGFRPRLTSLWKLRLPGQILHVLLSLRILPCVRYQDVTNSIKDGPGKQLFGWLRGPVTVCTLCPLQKSPGPTWPFLASNLWRFPSSRDNVPSDAEPSGAILWPRSIPHHRGETAVHVALE